MKKLLLVLSILFIVSCSKDCEYGGDKARVKVILADIAELEQKRDDAATESSANVYQSQIDRKKVELDSEISECR